MTRATAKHTTSQAMYGAAAWALTGVALAFCFCMASLGVTAHLDKVIVSFFSQFHPSGGFRELPILWLWSGAALGAFFVSSVLLHTPGWWRRWVFLAAALIVTWAWVPVLVISSMRPSVTIPCLAIVTAGAGALFYLNRHPEAAPTTSLPHETR